MPCILHGAVESEAVCNEDRGQVTKRQVKMWNTLVFLETIASEYSEYCGIASEDKTTKKKYRE